MKEFSVGAKIWFIDSGKPLVRLFLVSEEIIKKTMSGNTTEYVFETFHKGAKWSISSSELDGTFFHSRQEVFEHMHKQAATAIEGMLDKTEQTFDNLSEEKIESLSPHDVSTTGLKEDVIVELPNGQKARMKGGLK